MSTRKIQIAMLWICAIAPSFGWVQPSDTATIAPLSGVDQVVANDPEHSLIYSARGICKLRLRLAQGRSVQIGLLYAAGRPFTKIEGIEVFDNAAQRRLIIEEVVDAGQLRRHNDSIEISALDSELDWTVQVIDYYR